MIFNINAISRVKYKILTNCTCLKKKRQIIKNNIHKVNKFKSTVIILKTK